MKYEANGIPSRSRNMRSNKGNACRSFEIEWETRRNVVVEEGGQPSRKSGQTKTGPVKEHRMDIDEFSP